jgi:tetratricopeptide (TPR) repeat protein
MSQKKTGEGTLVAGAPVVSGGATCTLDGPVAPEGAARTVTAGPGSPRRAGAVTGERPREARTGRVAAERFEPEREVGRGGMATIYLARDREQPERPVALKLIHAHMATDERLVRRFLHEVRAHVGLKHPNIVEMMGWGRDDKERLFIAMEFVDGPMVKDVMTRCRRFPVDLAVHVAASMLKGLAAAHAAGIVHRDIKPANLMLSRSGRVKVADFGISKGQDMTQLTSTGNVIGTPAYMSPEQAMGRPIDGRSDLFSVGVFLYEMLLGNNPFLADNPATTLQRVVHHHQRPVFESLPQVPAALEALVEKLLKKDADERPLDAATAARELLDIAEAEGLAANEQVMAAFLADPEKTARRLDGARARKHFENAMRVYDQGRGTVEGALWQLFLATLLDPGHAEARSWLEQISTQQGYHLQRQGNEKIEELEATLKEDPDQLHVVLQLAKLHKAQGNFLQVIFYYKRAKALRPRDRYTQGQIETLVNARAVPLIDGTGMFETQDHVPVRLAAPGAARAPERQRAEGVGDFLRGVFSTGLGKAAAVAASLAVVVVVLGSFMESAVVASQSPVAGHAPTGDPGFDREAETLARASARADQGEHEKAEKLLRRFVEDYPASVLRSESLFRLGDTLERQGRREDARAIHAQNASEFRDDWSTRSLQRQAELALLDGDGLAARNALEDAAERAAGSRRLEAMLSLADLDRDEGEPRVASYAFEALVEETAGTELHDRARLGLAGALAEIGENARARALYAQVRDTTDHRSEAFSKAEAALAELNAGG